MDAVMVILINTLVIVVLAWLSYTEIKNHKQRCDTQVRRVYADREQLQRLYTNAVDQLQELKPKHGPDGRFISKK